MTTFLCFLWIAMPLFLFAESFTENPEKRTIKLLRELGRKECLDYVEKSMSDRFTSLPKKKEISQALKISYNSTLELFKKNRTHCHWKNDVFRDLMGHLNRQAQSHFAPLMSSDLETLVEDFKKLDQFLTQQNFTCCAWEIVRHEVQVVMGYFSKMTRRHV